MVRLREPRREEGLNIIWVMDTAVWVAAQAKEMGYDAIELCCGSGLLSADTSPQDSQDMREQLNRVGLREHAPSTSTATTTSKRSNSF